MVRALIAPAPANTHLIPIAIGVSLLGLLDRTLFLACRAEHYWTTVVCFVATEHWIPGATAVQLALWFRAGVSKLNHHFPSVVCVMASNSPLTRFAGFRRLRYRRYPDDLRPSRLAEGMVHAGTALELAVPTVLAFAGGGDALVVGLVLMVILHTFITSSVPMGMPLEWNVMAVYGGGNGAAGTLRIRLARWEWTVDADRELWLSRLGAVLLAVLVTGGFVVWTPLLALAWGRVPFSPGLDEKMAWGGVVALLLAGWRTYRPEVPLWRMVSQLEQAEAQAHPIAPERWSRWCSRREDHQGGPPRSAHGARRALRHHVRDAGLALPLSFDETLPALIVSLRRGALGRWFDARSACCCRCSIDCVCSWA